MAPSLLIFFMNIWYQNISKIFQMHFHYHSAIFSPVVQNFIFIAYSTLDFGCFSSWKNTRQSNNNYHIFGRNGTYVQNIYIKFIFTALPNNYHIFGRNGIYVQNIYIKFIFTVLPYPIKLSIKLLQNNLIQNHTVIKFKLLTKYILWNIYFQLNNSPPNINLIDLWLK